MAKTPKDDDSPARPKCALLVATSEGALGFANVNARRWLNRFFGCLPDTDVLPCKISQWLATEGKNGSGSLVIRQKSLCLIVRRYRPQPDDSIALLLELISRERPAAHRTHGRLTKRENDVLGWIAAGKSNKEIGEILGLSAGTVGKHLERIFLKLGVENRTAAASFYSEPEESSGTRRPAVSKEGGRTLGGPAP